MPIVGVLGVKNLEAAYQVKIASADLALLMQHRALLFGLLDGYVLYSCIYAQYQPAAMLMAVISMIGLGMPF